MKKAKMSGVVVVFFFAAVGIVIHQLFVHDLLSDEPSLGQLILLICVIVGIGVLMLIQIFVEYLIERFSARRYVLISTSTIAARFTEATMLIGSMNLDKQVSDRVERLRNRFVIYESLNAASKGVDWVDVREVLEKIDKDLSDTIARLQAVHEADQEEG